jgi:transcriptional regulator with GAF, ATPase, and Fis domain
VEEREEEKSEAMQDSTQSSPATEEILAMVNKGVEFIKEVMDENERLRFLSVQLQEENKEFQSWMEKGDYHAYLTEELHRLEEEKERLCGEYERVEHENQEYANRYIEVEEENNNLANLYVCSYQLHSTLDFEEVLQIIMEIIINLIGAEEFGILLLDEKSQRLIPVSMEGIPLEKVPPTRLGEGVIGQAAASGENYYAPEKSESRDETDLSKPMVCIPLKIKDEVIGVIVLYKLLPQKTQFANVDYELFTLLAGHAATAVFSAKLYSEAQRKLSTIEGFMELLTH